MTDKTYRANVDLSYRTTSGTEVTVAAGELVKDMTDPALKHEVKNGSVVEVESARHKFEPSDPDANVISRTIVTSTEGGTVSVSERPNDPTGPPEESVIEKAEEDASPVDMLPSSHVDEAPPIPEKAIIEPVEANETDMLPVAPVIDEGGA